MTEKFLRTAFAVALMLLAIPGRAALAQQPWSVLRTIPRPAQHFTQGLVFSGSHLFESTGRYGQSRLLRYDATRFELQQQYTLRNEVFAEGLTVIGHKLFQASWKSGEIFVYDLALQPLRTLPVSGESWGLTSDGHQLILSDGSDQLQFLDAATGEVRRTLAVREADGTPWRNLNELEWLEGDILANVWHQDIVLVIDSQTGIAKASYNLEKLAPLLRQHMPVRNGDQVLNGLAWNPVTRTLLVTGKDWPVWFELQIPLH